MKNTEKHVFNEYLWYLIQYDGRKKRYFRNLSRIDFVIAKAKHLKREKISWEKDKLEKTRFAYVKKMLEYFNAIPYQYQGDGFSDWQKYQRPCSNGVGYVAICPGEPGNNTYVDDPILVAILTRKYNIYMTTKQ